MRTSNSCKSTRPCVSCLPAATRLKRLGRCRTTAFRGLSASPISPKSSLRPYGQAYRGRALQMKAPGSEAHPGQRETEMETRGENGHFAQLHSCIAPRQRVEHSSKRFSEGRPKE